MLQLAPLSQSVRASAERRAPGPVVVACCWFLATLSPGRPETSHAQVIVPPALGGAGVGAVPPAGCDLALAALGVGDYSGALAIAAREHQGGIRAGAQRWIDSIATATAVGECHYELGNLREAVAAYDEALLLSAAHGEWLLSVQFPPQMPQAAAQRRVANWGQSQRNTAPGMLPATMSIRLAGADPQEVLQKGGVLSAPVNYPIRPQEIVRATVMALYRRAVILGVLAREGAVGAEATKTLQRRPAPPNHYTQSWIDIALGTALWSQGKADQAQPLLTRGLVMGNQLDHPLTCWGLLVLGRMALDADQPATAVKYFEEATYSAADYGDARGLEEAFRLAAAAHLAAGTRGVPATIRGAAAWAAGSLPVLRATLLCASAEALAAAGDAAGAAATLADFDGRLLRGDPARGSVGAQHAYATALTAYAAGDIADGDRELERGLAVARHRCPQLFQTTRLVEMVVAGAGGISDRQADLLFAGLLADPSPRSFAFDPLGSLALLTAGRDDAFAAWVDAAVRRGNDAALHAIESSIRSRWLVAQPLGGRRLAVERLLESDAERLSRAEAANRAAILARRPGLGAVLDDLVRVRVPLTAALAAAAGQPVDANAEGGANARLPGDPDAWRRYQALADKCRHNAAAIAAGRDVATLEMPPLTPPPEIRRRLAAGQLILSFSWTAGGLRGALESRDRVVTWQIRQPAAVAKEIGLLARGMCLFDAVAPVPTDRLAAGEWQLHAERIEKLLFENSKTNLGDGITELVVVPDGALWYLPFELLPVGSDRRAAPADAAASKTKRLRDACRIRYCPTRSLAVARFEPSRSGGTIGIHAGRMHRGEKAGASRELSARLAGSLDRAVVMPSGPGVPLASVASLVDTLLVVDELAAEGPTAARSLATLPNGRTAMTFAEWLVPPAKRAGCVVLPGFQSAVAGGLAKMPARAGEELFLAVTDLLAAGGRTALVSRWRMGGKTSVDLVEEFLRDRTAADGVGPPPASESWQRAVEIATAEQPDLGQEPRLRQAAQAVLADARHPLLWAGYMLVDCGGGRYDEPAAAAQAGKAVAPAPKPDAEPDVMPKPPPQPAPKSAPKPGPLNPAVPRQPAP